MAWIIANWALIKDLVMAILVVDAALIPLFPKVGALITIKNALSGVAGK